MSVHSAHLHLHAVDVKTVVGTNLDGAEAELLFLKMQLFSVFVNKSKVSLVSYGLLGTPLAYTLHAEIYVAAVASASHGSFVAAHLLALHVENLGAYLCTFKSAVKFADGGKVSVGLGINRNLMDIESRASHHENRANKSAKVPVVGTTLREVYAGVLALLANLNGEHIFL